MAFMKTAIYFNLFVAGLLLCLFSTSFNSFQLVEVAFYFVSFLNEGISILSRMDNRDFHEIACIASFYSSKEYEAYAKVHRSHEQMNTI